MNFSSYRVSSKPVAQNIKVKQGAHKVGHWRIFNAIFAGFTEGSKHVMFKGFTYFPKVSRLSNLARRFKMLVEGFKCCSKVSNLVCGLKFYAIFEHVFHKGSIFHRNIIRTYLLMNFYPLEKLLQKWEFPENCELPLLENVFNPDEFEIVYHITKDLSF